MSKPTKDDLTRIAKVMKDGFNKSTSNVLYHPLGMQYPEDELRSYHERACLTLGRDRLRVVRSDQEQIAGVMMYSLPGDAPKPRPWRQPKRASLYPLM